MTQFSSGALAGFSAALADLVAQAASSVVRVDDGSRLTATGVVWADGVIVTTSHGLERDDDLAIETASGERRAAALLGRDPDTDLAALRADTAGLSPVTVTPDAEARIGSLALVLARPGDMGLQTTIGIVSGRIDTETAGRPGYILHTDAVLYPGFSGGALLDVQGRIMGITNLLFGRGRSVAIGAPVVAAAVESLLAGGQRPRYLGIRTQEVDLPAPLQAALGRDQSSALLIVQIEPGAAADRAGLLLGDLIVGLDSQTITGVDTLRRGLRASPGAAGDVAVEVLRGGERRTLRATPEEDR